jgi:membrane-associated phospholipid phosphatase
MAGGARRLVRERRYRFLLIAAAAIFALNALESYHDDAVTAALGYDLTPRVHALEGDRGAVLQRLASPGATWVFSFAYIVLFPTIMLAPVLLAAAGAGVPACRAFLKAIIINYAVCLPFYLLAPVKEMWAGNPDHVRLLLDDVSPRIIEAYRSTSALDNCLPSFHVSLSVTVAILAWRTGPRAFSAATVCAAALVVVGTIYLGVHWLTDVAAGVLLGITAAVAAGRELIPVPPVSDAPVVATAAPPPPARATSSRSPR